MKSSLFTLLAVTLLAAASTGQAQTYFNERLPRLTGGQELTVSIIPNDSGYVASGETFFHATSIYGLTIRFLNPDGQQRRIRLYHAPTSSFSAGTGENLQGLPDGGYAVVGGCNLPTIGYAIRLWRFDSVGDTLWTRTFLAGARWAQGMCRTRDGGFALVGTADGSVPSTQPGSELLLLRTDSLGTLLWQKRYRWNQRINTGWSVQEMADGGFVLGGVTSDLGYVNQGTYIVRTDSVGTQRWHRRVGTFGLINGIGIVRPTRDGGVALLGAVAYPAGGTARLFRQCVYKLNDLGNVVWQREIGPVSYTAYCTTLLELPDGSLVGAGQEGGPTTATVEPQGVIFKVCPDGDSLWYRTYQRLAHSPNYLRGLAATPDGGFVAAGFLHVRAPDTGTPDAWVFKVDSAGYLQAGGAPVGVTCRPLGVGNAAAAPAPVAALYPNPTAGAVTLAYAVPAGARGAHVVLFDALGKRCGRHPLAGGSGETRLPLTALPAGVYTYRILVNGAPVQVGKFVKLP